MESSVVNGLAKIIKKVLYQKCFEKGLLCIMAASWWALLQSFKFSSDAWPMSLGIGDWGGGSVAEAYMYDP